VLEHRVLERLEGLTELTTWRRRLHQYPEVAFHEFETTKYLTEVLRSMDIEVSHPGETGLVGYIKGRGPGPVVAVRADIDALPLQEEKEVEYASKIPNAMHACGHDGHTAIALGVAKIFSGLRDEFTGEIRLIFQPAEEHPPGGAKDMIAAGVLEDVQAIFGLHLWTSRARGKVGIASGPVMAASDQFKIRLYGKGGHGSAPQQTIDTVVLAAQLINNLQNIVSRKVDPLSPAVLSIGTVNAGSAFNIIADKAELTGTVRTFAKETQELVIAELERITSATCESFGAKYELEYVKGYPAVVNDMEMTEFIKEVAQDVLGPSGIEKQEPVMGGEDFAYYLQEVPGSFVFLGAHDPQTGEYQPHHHPKFDIDEKVLPLGVELMARAVARYLDRE